ncbi:hypothetical protein [Bdellovibrio sp. HCB2-146]|uniref:hypothetical protein n=1 Tax=Bdellovibrio sp. HCB2-146 TaxID=3394362 RepID=UPI0039BD8D50
MRKFKDKFRTMTICMGLFLTVACQSVQHQSASDNLNEAQIKASQNRILSNQIVKLREEAREAQSRGDYYGAADLRREIREVQIKLTLNGGKSPQEYDMYESDNYRYRNEVQLWERTNANSTYSNGELTTSSKMLRNAQ